LRDLWNSTVPGKNDLNPPYCSQNNQTGCIYEDDIIVGHVLQEIEAHDPSVPLFYYWAPHNIHGPLQVAQNYLDMYNFIDDEPRRIYTAMVHHMDDMVGMVIDKLKEKGMWNNTLLVMSSDNGGPLVSANNYPLKGGKLSNWEGGIRVNAFVSGGYVPESLRGTKSEDFIAISDWYATFSTIAGIDPTDGEAKSANLPPIDSYNMWPLLTRTNKTNPRTEIPIGSQNAGNGNEIFVEGIIVPPHKLLIGVVPLSFWQGPLYPNISTNFTYQDTLKTNCHPACLFHLLDDPYEQNDIASLHPLIVANLTARINEYQKTVFNVDRGEEDPTACATAREVYGGFFGPWVSPQF